MPRSSASKKAHSNHRHENGLVGPGKRITKQKSNGQLNGAPKGAPPDTPPQSPILSANQVLNDSTANNSNGSLSEPSKDSNNLLRPATVTKRVSDSSVDASEAQQSGIGSSKPAEDVSRQRADTNTSKRTTADLNAFQLASTILRSCPLYDTIAILILLLQLPPLVLTLVQALFASLTFMPPTGLSLGSFFSLIDILQGSVGTPSFGTMIFVDAICLGGWYCLWTWARNFALDLAQVHVAITLGGGSSGKTGGVNTFCVAIVLGLHLFRSRGVRHFIFDYILSTKVFTDHHIAQVGQYFPRDVAPGSMTPTPSWVRSLFAIHIITQAGIAMIRRRVQASQNASLTKPPKRSDTEATAGVPTPPDSAGLESGSTSATAASADAAQMLSSPSRDGKDRVTSLKKRRRQAHQVRSRQPFWAALASTKVTVMREYEHSRVSTTATGPQKGEVVEFPTSEESLVWISSISPSSIKFVTSDVDVDTDSQEDDTSLGSKPFYVRINGAYWTATNICPVDDQQGETNGAQWRGEIAGLAPNCTYTCSFVTASDDEEFSVVTVKTPALPDTEQSSPPARQLLRPSSPTTTIKNSIATAEAKLNESRNRLIRMRRSHKASLSKLEKEVDSYTTRLKANSDDTKQRQKLLQAERNMRQTEDATHSVEAALGDLATIPEEDVDEWEILKSQSEAQNARFAEASESLEKARGMASSDVSSINDELKTLAARRERLNTRQARLAEQHDRITQANAQGLNEKERKAAETSAKEAERYRSETQFHHQYAIMNREIQELQVRTNQAWQQVQVFESAAQQTLRNNTGPLTPEGPLPGTQSLLASNSNPFNARPAFGYPGAYNSTQYPPVTMSPEPQHVSPFLNYAKPQSIDNYGAPSKNNSFVYNNAFSSNYRSRPRSSSNRSGGNNSNFSADFEDADPIPPGAGNNPDFADLVNSEKRKSSGSSRSANDGSPVNNAMSGMASPIGTGRGSPGHSIW